MERFITHFQRVSRGVWDCVSPIEIDLPSGRVQVTPGTRVTIGVKFMGVDIARLLDEQSSQQSKPE